MLDEKPSAGGNSRAWPRLARYEDALPPLLFFLMLSAVSHWWRAYMFDFDEGLNLMKGALVANGFSLYADIWSDQPPLLTLLLAGAHLLFPFTVEAGRAIVLGFSGLLLWSLFRIIRRLEGRLCAWLAVGALVAVKPYPQLSVSVMVGLPAVALAIAALDQALAGAFDQKSWRYWMAGVLFALALQTKLFVIVLLPALMLAVLYPVGRQTVTWRSRTAHLALMTVSGATVFLAVAISLGEPLIAQLIEPHYRAKFMGGFGGPTGLLGLLSENIPVFVLLLFVLGGLVVLSEMTAARLVPLVWLGSALLALASHRPLFPHQLLLIYVPVAWIAALSRHLVDKRISRAAAMACVVVLAAIAAKATWRLGPPGPDWKFASLLRESSPDRFVLADNMMDAYRAGRLVPPELAVWSGKRLSIGRLTSAQMIEAVRAHRPEHILLRRFRQPKEFIDYLAADYTELRYAEQGEGQPPLHHYVRRRRTSPLMADATLRSATGALITATKMLNRRSVSGGFAGHYDLRTGRAWGRSWHEEPMDADSILVRRPGSTVQLGQCFLRAHVLTGAELFWMAALESGRALACAQGREGGWASVAHLTHDCRPASPRPRDARATLDEATSQSAVALLMDLAAYHATKPAPPPAWLAKSIGKGLDFLVRAQKDSGGWPQKYPSTGNFSAYATLNDGVTSEVIAVLLRAYKETGNRRFLDAAERGGDFLIRAQGPEAQPAWAQQYDANNRPAPARSFEPAAYSSEETGFAMNALLDLYAATGKPRYLTGLAAASEWLRHSRIRADSWARLYELGTNRPIYGDRDGKVHYTLEELSAERRKGYRWEANFPAASRALGRYEAAKEGIDSLRRYDDDLARREREQAGQSALALLPRVVSAFRPGQGWSEDGVLSTRTFVENCDTVLNSLEFGATRSGSE